MKYHLILALCLVLISSGLTGIKPFINPQTIASPFNPGQRPQAIASPINQGMQWLPVQTNRLSAQSSNQGPKSQPLAVRDDEYILRWKWGARSGYVNHTRGLFYWNGQLIANLTTFDYRIHTATYHVKARNGVNTLRLKAQGWDPVHNIGFDVENITLKRKGGHRNYLINGDFQATSIYNTWQRITNTTGWTSADGTSFHIGKGCVFNPVWGQSKIAELQNAYGMNSDISQNITLKVKNPSNRPFELGKKSKSGKSHPGETDSGEADTEECDSAEGDSGESNSAEGLQLQRNQLSIQSSNQGPKSRPLAVRDDEYILRWKWGARSGYVNHTRGLFYWNGQLIANLTTFDYNIHTSTYHVKARNGVNTLRLKAQGWDPVHNIGFDVENITLKRKGGHRNYLINGDFQSTSIYGTWQRITNTTGWTSAEGTSFQIGKGCVFNPVWGQSKIAELQNAYGMNSDISQNITLKVKNPSNRPFELGKKSKSGKSHPGETDSETDTEECDSAESEAYSDE